jgi:hypothetical protein
MSCCKSCSRNFATLNPDRHCFDCAGYADSEWNAEAFRLLAAKDALARRIPKPAAGYTVVLPGGAFPYTFKDRATPTLITKGLA